MSQNPTQITIAGTWSVIAIAVGAGVVPALQPLLLGSLLNAGRLDPVTLGHAATLESLGMAITSVLATFCLRPVHLRPLMAVALLATLAAGGCTMLAQGSGIVWARGLNGAANGLLLWILVGLMTRARHPAQVFAYYITGQSVMAFGLSTLFADVVLPMYGANATYLVLLGLNVLLLVAAVPLAPRAYAPLGSEQGGISLPPTIGWVALLGVGAQIAAIMAFWVYAVPLAARVGFEQEQANRIISTANIGLIVAGIAACLTASRFKPVPVILATTAASLLVLFTTMTSSSAAVWTVALLVFTFGWTYAPPFHITYLIEADPSGRAAMLVSPAQLLGMAAGPMAAAGVVADGDVTGARMVAIAGFAASFLIALIVQFRSSSVSTA
ncbi:MAG: hypothetical protein AB7E05_06850 [Sphingobium sp.]